METRRHQEGTWEVRIWEKMVGLGETTQSDLVERKKGYPHPSVFEKFYQVFYRKVEMVPAISIRENSISKCFV